MNIVINTEKLLADIAAAESNEDIIAAKDKSGLSKILTEVRKVEEQKVKELRQKQAKARREEVFNTRKERLMSRVGEKIYYIGMPGNGWKRNEPVELREIKRTRCVVLRKERLYSIPIYDLDIVETGVRALFFTKNGIDIK